MITLNEFITKWNNKFCEVTDPTNPNQCYDLAIAWTDALGIPRVFPFMYASQIYTNFGSLQAQYFDRIANTVDAVPQAGDIIIWDGSVGHVAIATGKGDLNGFTSFDQNWPLNSVCHYQDHNYDNPPVLGWLRPKKGFDTQIPSDDCPLRLKQVTEERDRLNGVITGKDETIAHLGATIDQKNSELATLQATVASQTASLLTKDQSIATLTEQANKVVQLTKDLEDTTASRKLYTDQVSALQTQIGTIKNKLIPKKYLSKKLYDIIMTLE